MIVYNICHVYMYFYVIVIGIEIPIGGHMLHSGSKM